MFAGHDGKLRVWSLVENEVKGVMQAHKVIEKYQFLIFKGAIEQIQFSENGFNFATSSASEKVVKLWDLRKLSEDNYIPLLEGSAGSICFDRSGRYLAVGTNDLLLYNIKNNSQFAKFRSHNDSITSIR